MHVVWKRINGFEDYEISSYGAVRSYKHNKPRLLKFSVNHKGYLYVRLYRNDGKQHKKYCHVLVAENFLIKPSEKHQVNHINGIKTDNEISNLEWLTASENCKHAHKNGLRTLSNTRKPREVLKRNKDGKIIKYVSMTQASKLNNVARSTIREHCLNGKDLNGEFYSFI